jgi:hypothetical protein
LGAAAGARDSRHYNVVDHDYGDTDDQVATSSAGGGYIFGGVGDV